MSGTSFTDSTAVNGTAYHYVVDSGGRLDNESGTSNDTTATPLQVGSALA